MNAAKKGYVAEFKTGYLQIEVRKELKVADGADSGLRNPFDMGIAVGRMAKIAGGYLKPAASIDDAEFIVAQSDDTVIDLPRDISYPERYSTLPNLIVKNSEREKTVALYKIVDKEDIKLRKVAEPVSLIAGTYDDGAVTTDPTTYMFKEVGVNSYVALGFVPYTTSNPVNNPDGNILYFTLKNADITAKSQLPEGDIYHRYSNEASKPVNSATRDDFEADGSIQCAVWVDKDTQVLKITVEWVEGEVSNYLIDLTNLTMGVSA